MVEDGINGSATSDFSVFSRFSLDLMLPKALPYRRKIYLLRIKESDSTDSRFSGTDTSLFCLSLDLDVNVNVNVNVNVMRCNALYLAIFVPKELCSCQIQVNNSEVRLNSGQLSGSSPLGGGRTVAYRT
jgi:hypothetical protein